MKRIISFILKTVILVQVLALGACTPEIAEEAAEGFVIKSFMPTTVMAGCEMVITGNGFKDVVSVVFPEGIEVTDFEVVTDNQIKVIVPSGIIQEGGKLSLISSDKTIESKISMRPAKPVVKSLDPGDEIKPGKVLTIKGEDLEFIKEVIFPGKEEGETISIQTMDFLRKSPDNVKVNVPEGIFKGVAAITLIAADGKSIKTPEITMTSGPSVEDNYIFCTIMSAAVERYITRNPSASTPIIQDKTGGKDQEFVFIPVDGEYGTYYLKNVGSGEYLSIGAEYEWRMGWYADPSEAPKPENAKFQVFPLENTDGYYRIHVLGSIDLGLDSTADWSEVYSNKSDKSNPYYQWVINKTSGPDFADPNSTPPVEIVPSTLWEGAAEPNPDDSGWVSLYLSAEELSGISVGSILRMYFTPTEGQWQQLDYRDGNDGAVAGYEWAGMDGFTTFADGYIDLEVTQELYDRISATGISFRGFWFTITKIEHIGPAQTPPAEGGDEKFIWEGSVYIEWTGMDELSWGKYDWSTVTPGTILTAHVELSPDHDYWQIRFAKGNGWSSLPTGMELGDNISMEAGTTQFSITLSEADLDELVNQGGLIITGTNFTLTGLSLK